MHVSFAIRGQAGIVRGWCTFKRMLRQSRPSEPAWATQNTFPEGQDDRFKVISCGISYQSPRGRTQLKKGKGMQELRPPPKKFSRHRRSASAARALEMFLCGVQALEQAEKEDLVSVNSWDLRSTRLTRLQPHAKTFVAIEDLRSLRVEVKTALLRAPGVRFSCFMPPNRWWSFSSKLPLRTPLFEPFRARDSAFWICWARWTPRPERCNPFVTLPCADCFKEAVLAASGR